MNLKNPKSTAKIMDKPRRGGAFFVAAGIFLSRIAGLLRERALAHYLGNSDAADAFKAALKIPNFLQNLFGEGVLSASFIPVYAQKVAAGQGGEAREIQESKQIAFTIFTLLSLVTSFLTLAGVVSTPWLIDLIAPGFQGAKRDMTIHLVRVLFPGTGLLVLSAWCLGVLNSHQRFFLSYVAPVVWNLAIILALVVMGAKSSSADLVVYAAWGLVAGSFLQFAVQFPTALKCAGKFSWSWSWRQNSIVLILKNFVPAVMGRGVVQISAYIDNIIASLLPTGAVSALSFAQQIYLLPISLFGMSVSASELPRLSSASGTQEEIQFFLQARLKKALRQIVFFVLPCAVVFVVLGDVVVAALYQTGKFDQESTQYVWMVLIGYAVGLLANTQSRLYSSAFYSMKDSKTPLKFAGLRVLISTLLGVGLSIELPRLLLLPSWWGTVGVTLAASCSGWLEYYWLRRRLQKVIGPISLDKQFIFSVFIAALAAGAGAKVLHIFCWRIFSGQEASWAPLPPFLLAILVLGAFGVLYLGFCCFFQVEEGFVWLKKLKNWRRR